MPNVRQDIIQADPRYQDAILGGDDVFATLPSGQNIRGHLWRSGRDKAPKFLILPGFTEFCEKYAHVAKRMVQMGFDCLIIDWPGQGRSGHLGDDKMAVHCEGFDGHIAALEALVAHCGWHRYPRHLLAHSMGGHLALLIAAKWGDKVASLALSAPMIVPNAKPAIGIRLLAYILTVAGKSKSYAPFTRVPELTELAEFNPDNMLTNDPAGFAWQTYWFHQHPHLRRYGATVGWVATAYGSYARYTSVEAFYRSLKMPALVMRPEQEQVVDSKKIAFAATYMPQADLVMIADAKHELFNETAKVDHMVWDHLTRFWDRIGLPVS